MKEETKISFKCPFCLFNWTETVNMNDWKPPQSEECTWCKERARSPVEILRQQLTCMESISVQDFPKVMRRLARHIQLFDNDTI